MLNDVIKQNEILFVDDSPAMLAMAKKMLGETYVLHTASNGAAAYEIIVKNQSISMIFIDMNMPDNNGIQLLQKMKESEDIRISKMTIIIVTSKLDAASARRKVFDLGATDFISKPFDTLDLAVCARAHLGKDYSRSGVTAKEHANNMDMLVSPANFHSIGTQALHDACEKKVEFSIVYIEIVNYKDLKDNIGDIAVKQVIVTLAARIAHIIQEKDVASRIGEDKYVILFYTENKHAEDAVKKLYNYLKKVEFIFNDKMIKAELKYGYSSVDAKNRSLTFTELCNQASMSLGGVDIAKNSTPVLQYISDKFSIGKQKSSNIEIISGSDLWSALKYVADGDYELVPKSHKHDLIKCMEAYIEYARTSQVE